MQFNTVHLFALLTIGCLIGCGGDDQNAPVAAPAASAPDAASSTSASTDATSSEGTPWVDLLANVDPNEHGLRGSIRSDGKALITDALNGACLVRCEEVTRPRYQIRAVVTRDDGDGSLFFVMPIAGVDCALVIDSGHPEPPATGLALLDGHVPKSKDYDARAYRGQVLQKGNKYDIDCEVDGTKFVLRVNQRLVYRWSGDAGRLSLTDFYKSDFPGHILFGSAGSVFRIDRLELREMPPNVGFVRAAPRQQMPPSAMSGPPVPFPFAAPVMQSPGPWPPIVAHEQWEVPSSGNPMRDRAVSTDIRFVREREGLRVNKTFQSDMIWLLRKPAMSGDFVADLEIVLPSLQQLMAGGGPGGAIAFGAHPSAGSATPFIIPSPPPLAMESRRIRVRIQRVEQNVSAEVDGNSVGSPSYLAGTVQMGITLQGSAHFWIVSSDVRSGAPEVNQLASNQPVDPQPSSAVR